VGAAGTLRRWVDGSQADGTFLQRLVTFAVGLAVIAGLIAVDSVVFRAAFDSNYVHWYLKNGALIGIVFGLITLAWGDLNRMATLISAHPHDYVATCFHLAVLPQVGVAALIETPSTWLLRKQKERKKLETLVSGVEQLVADPELPEELKHDLAKAAEEGRASVDELTSELAAAEEDDAPKVAAPRGLGGLDVLLAVVFGFAFLLLCIVWLLVIAPLQYVVNLVAGAPARRALASPARASFWSTPGALVVGEASKERKLAEGATESRFSTAPVTFTSAVASALLFLVTTFTEI
jgi:hypothetical protein